MSVTYWTLIPKGFEIPTVEDDPWSAGAFAMIFRTYADESTGGAATSLDLDDATLTAAVTAQIERGLELEFEVEGNAGVRWSEPFDLRPFHHHCH
ncbi:hypothetical protein [Rhizobium sp. BG4]|uniref:hypothetical protein n=1 Tax=Rhizobium sp. BG4 TaxID=2613770 RepID=UPI00193DF494|nr:hypothetical protein [Rhizobium sp. BG4]QRM45356.1 hypothetical protein F2982_19060 [Rhizobium sp. BG4]